jgi:Fe-S cluster biogenesis protein NfuA
MSHPTIKQDGGENELQKMWRSDGGGKVFIHFD